jgi:hypothetical protein
MGVTPGRNEAAHRRSWRVTVMPCDNFCRIAAERRSLPLCLARRTGMSSERRGDRLNRMGATLVVAGRAPAARGASPASD